MTAETNKFIIATFALWAGDFSYFENLLREFSPPHDTKTFEGRLETPEEVIRATGPLRLRQLWQKRGEFKKLALEYAGQGVEIIDKPTLLETKHLRATLWRTGEREFLMQGYLKELDWQDTLFELAHSLATKAVLDNRPHSTTLSATAERAAQGQATKPLGIAWTVTGDLLLQIELTDLALLEANGVWTAQRLPQNAEAITNPFQKLLNGLDEP